MLGIVASVSDGFTMALLEDGTTSWASRSWVADVQLSRTVALRVGSIGLLFQRIADLLLFVTFIELGNGFLYALTRKREKYQRTMRWAAISIAFIFLILAIAIMGLANTVVHEAMTKSFEYSTSRGTTAEGDFGEVLDAFRRARPHTRLSGAYYILNWLISLWAMVYASFVMHKYTSIVPSKGVSLARCLPEWCTEYRVRGDVTCVIG